MYTQLYDLSKNPISAVPTVPATGHSVTTDEAAAPTCTEAGLTEGSHCAACGEVFTAQQVIPALGHAEAAVPCVAPTCTETGLTGGTKCSNCQMVMQEQTVLPALGHSFADGSCVRCGATAIQVLVNGQWQSADSLTQALAMETDGYVCLLDDVTEDVTVTTDAKLDLNGFDLTGDITVESGATLYLFDSATADYTAANRGKVVGTITGNIARSFNTPASYGHNYKYMVIREADGSWSSHRYYLTVRSAVLQPWYNGETAVNYKTVFKCNEVAAQYISQYGVKLTGDNTVYADHMARSFQLLTGDGNTNAAYTYLVGTMKQSNSAEQNAANAVRTPAAQAYICLADGTELTSGAVQVSAKELICHAAAQENLSDRQKTALGNMYAAFSDVIDTWTDVDLDALRQYAQQFSTQLLATVPQESKKRF